MRAFGKDIAALIHAAHDTRHLAVAYVNNLEEPALPALDRIAKAHAEEARRTAVATLQTAWNAEKKGAPDRVLFYNLSYMVLAAIASERFVRTAAERDASAVLFERMAQHIELDPTWRELRKKLVEVPKPNE